MVVAPTDAETLERACFAASPRRFASSNDRAGTSSRPKACLQAAPAMATHSFAVIPGCRWRTWETRDFRGRHGLRFPCMSGAMANGIGSVEIVEAMARGGFLGVFGSAGLSLGAIEHATDRIEEFAGDSLPFGMNLIHSPGEPELESAVVDLYLRRGVTLVEASAFLNLTLPVVRYRVAGISRDASGRMVAPNRIIAKVSRVEVASKFMAPPPDAVPARAGRRRARSRRAGGAGPRGSRWPRTSPRKPTRAGTPTISRRSSLLPTMLALRDQMQAQHGYDRPLRVGAAGGISTPWAAAAAFAMGAAYVVTGSVNQSCVEAGTSDAVRRMLAQAQQADVAMAPAADMFEMGVKVQVLEARHALRDAGRQALRALPDPRRAWSDFPPTERASSGEDDLPGPARRRSGSRRRTIFAKRDPSRIERAERDPKQKMALVFRWYLGHVVALGQRRRAVADGRLPDLVRPGDGGVQRLGPRARSWSSPRIGGWSTVALNILYGAAVLTRGRIAEHAGLVAARRVCRGSRRWRSTRLRTD